NHLKGDDRTMFACTNGVAAKCVRLEYKPWKVLNGQSLWKYHQACTRMLRADYCGDGLPRTREGTPIVIHDRLIHNPQAPDQTPPDPQMSFEAAWDEDGAVYVNRPRWSEKTAAIQRKCPTKFQSGKRIRTVEQAQKRYPQALIFNESIDRQPK
uniref:ADYC domain-containing protein n=1 Tax=Chamaesiphon sp. VAR_48_metabat_135_sub TaxID=2964699 RepID=UPI00286BD6D5